MARWPKKAYALITKRGFKEKYPIGFMIWTSMQTDLVIWEKRGSKDNYWISFTKVTWWILYIRNDNRAGGTGNDGDINSVADCPICNSYNLENQRKIRDMKYLQPVRIWMMQLSFQRGNISLQLESTKSSIQHKVPDQSKG